MRICVRQFPASRVGYSQLLAWLGGFGTVCLVAAASVLACERFADRPGPISNALGVTS
jgi:hypothetical protein